MLCAVLMRIPCSIIMKGEVISNIPKARIISLISMKGHSFFLKFHLIVSTLKKKRPTMKFILCLQMNSLSRTSYYCYILNNQWQALSISRTVLIQL